MSLCDICPKPGNCCKEIYISKKGISLGDFVTATEANIKMATEGFPFIALPERKPHGFLFTCPMLAADGRCSIYEHRPELCRNYETASDPLCVFHGTNIKNQSIDFNGEGLA